VALAMTQLIESILRTRSESLYWKHLIPYVTIGTLITMQMLVLPGPAVPYIGENNVYNGVPQLVSTIIYNLLYYVYMGSKFVGASYLGIASYLILLLPLMTYGLFQGYRKDLIFCAFLVAYMSVLILYPFHQGARFLVPLVPVVAYFGAAGVTKSEFWLGKRKANCVYLLIVLIAILHSSVQWMNSTVVEGPYLPESQTTFAFIKQNTSRNDVIVFFKPRALSLYTRRTAILQLDVDAIINGPAQYLLIYIPAHYDDNGINQQLLHFTTERPGSFGLLYTNPRFNLFRIIRPRHSRSPRSESCVGE